MTTPQKLAGVEFLSDHNPIPARNVRPLAANAQVGAAQIVTLSRTTGYCALNDGETPDEIALGLGSDVVELSDVNATAGNAWARYDMRHAYGLLQSALTNDSFTGTDFLLPVYGANENTVGKLAYTGADATLKNRPLLGLMMGINPDYNNLPIVWISPYAQLMARSMIANDNAVIAGDTFALTANTTRAEVALRRTVRAKGRVVKVRICAAGGFTAHDTNFWTITIAKRTATTPGTAVTLATQTLKTSGAQGGTGNLTAFKYADIALTETLANLLILEDDVITITCTAEATAAAIAQLTVEVIARVAS